ncbi:MAG: ATP-binding protein [bacterium]
MARRRRKLLWQLFPSTLLILLLALVAIGFYASRELRTRHLRDTADGLRSRAQLLAELIPREPVPPPHRIQELCRRFGKQTTSRFTVILPSGKVLGDSQKSPDRMDDHSDRPEVHAALAGRIGRAIRYSSTLDQDMMYLAVPLYRNGRVVAAVRASVPLSALSETLRRIYWRLALVGLFIALAAAGLSLFVAHRINRPLREMQAGAKRFADGELRYRLAVPSAEEPGALAEAMNAMAAQLDTRIQTVTSQRNELEAMLTSMIEAVLVVDAQGRLVRFNHAAEHLLDLDPEAAQSRPIEEAIRNVELHQLIQRILEERQPQEAEIELHRDGQRYLRAVGTALLGGDDQTPGALVVLHDLTRLRRLEVVRRDFVANVSHELRTPITAIQGFVETLRDGALDDPQDAHRFLEIIARQADRLNAIITDLLNLSRLEDSATRPLQQEPVPVKALLQSAIQVCQQKANQATVSIALEGALDTELIINAPLIEQAVINLCDNAINYSDPGGTVRIVVEPGDTEVVVAVTDDGCGIPEADQARVFERFYRVDKARSRELGGTGLGLAIVKHIANVHQGRVSLESSVGQGSTFRIHFPTAPHRA